MAWEEPTENPFMRKAPAPAAPPPDPPAEAVEVRAPVVASNPAYAARQVDDVPLSEPASASVDDVPPNSAAVADWKPKSKRGTEKAVALKPAAAEGGSGSSGGGGGCCKRCCASWCSCMGTCHAFAVQNSVCLNLLVTMAMLLCFGLFGYSAWLLKGSAASAGTCPATACIAGFSSSACLALPGAVQSCDDVCVNSHMAQYAPFLFSTDNSPGAVACTFSSFNTNWRLPTTFFGGVFAILAVIARLYRWRGIMMLCAFMFLAVGGISFYIMIIDASAVVNGYNQCTNKFADISNVLSSANMSCDRATYGAVVVLDAVISVLALYLSAVLVGAFRWMALPPAAAAAAAARRGGGGAAAAAAGPPGMSAEDKRRMFEKPEEAEEVEAPKRPFEK